MAEEKVSIARQTSFAYQNAPKHPPAKPLLPPAPISPLIRFTRWSALALGLTYGFYHNRRLNKKEARHHEHEEKLRPAREAAAAREKMIKQREEMLTLAAQVGMPVPADFDQQYKVPDGTVVIVKKH